MSLQTLPESEADTRQPEPFSPALLDITGLRRRELQAFIGQVLAVHNIGLIIETASDTKTLHQKVGAIGYKQDEWRVMAGPESEESINEETSF